MNTSEVYRAKVEEKDVDFFLNLNVKDFAEHDEPPIISQSLRKVKEYVKWCVETSIEIDWRLVHQLYVRPQLGIQEINYVMTNSR